MSGRIDTLPRTPDLRYTRDLVLHREEEARVEPEAGPNGILRLRDNVAIAQMLGTRQATSLLDVLAGAMDNALAFMLAASSDGDHARADGTYAQLLNAALTEETQAALRQSVLEAAQAAQESSDGLSNAMPKWAQTLVAGILMVVGTVAAAFTGGASLALMVAAVVLLAAGETMTHLMEEGVIESTPTTMGITMGLQAAGAILSTIAGNVGGGTGVVSTGVQIGRTATQVAEQVVNVIDLATTTASATTQILSAVRAEEHDQRMADVAVYDGILEDVRGFMDRAQEDLVGIIEGVRDMTEAYFAIQNQQQEASLMAVNA